MNSCSMCNGRGYVIVDRGPRSAAMREPCACRARMRDDQVVTMEDLAALAVARGKRLKVDFVDEHRVVMAQVELGPDGKPVIDVTETADGWRFHPLGPDPVGPFSNRLEDIPPLTPERR